MKIIIAGTRTFDDYQLLKETLDEYVFLLEIRNAENITEIVSGGCRGADMLGEKYARENGIPIKRFPADWNKHGKAAGPIRNQQMVDYADDIFVFWDGKSRGTEGIISMAKIKGMPICVTKY